MNCIIPSHSLFKWIITDEEENAVPSIVLTIGDTEPIRSYYSTSNLIDSYIFNLNSLQCIFYTSLKFDGKTLKKFPVF